MAHSWVHKDRGELRIYENSNELSTDLADYIAELSEASVKERGVFAIALSGGSLIGLMGKLCEAPYNKTVDWAKWYIFWADERVVAKNHSDSNYKVAKDGLLSKVRDIAYLLGRMMTQRPWRYCILGRMMTQRGWRYCNIFVGHDDDSFGQDT